MIPNRHAMVGARPSAGLGLIANLKGTAGTPIAYPSLVQPGDLAVLAKLGTAPSPWTLKAAASRTPAVFALALGPADIITPLAPNSDYDCLIYRGIRSIELRAIQGHQGPPGSAVNELGFVKSPDCAGRLALSGVGLTYSIPTVSTFTVRATNSGGGSHWNIWDNMDVDGFVSGAGVNLTWNTSDPSGANWSMFELLK